MIRPIIACGWLLLLTSASMAAEFTVAADGSGTHTSVQAAIDAVPSGSRERTTIHIKPGVYKERLRIEKNKAPITLLGLGEKPHDVVLTYDLKASSVVPPATQPVGTSGSASTTINASDLIAKNLTFENSAGNVGQAVAVKIQGDRGFFEDCRFLGWQDTLCVDGGRQYFRNCHIEGRVDFIFGRSTAVFEGCTIHSKNGGYVTAARTTPGQKFGYVFIDCTLTGEGDTAFLGRPWQWDRGSNAAVAFIRCRMGPHIKPEGWNPWDLKDKKNETPQAVTRYVEHGSMDLEGKSLDVSGRVTWSKQLSDDEARAYTVKNVLKGEDGWMPE
jgi:pectinesterase